MRKNLKRNNPAACLTLLCMEYFECCVNAPAADSYLTKNNDSCSLFIDITNGNVSLVLSSVCSRYHKRFGPNCEVDMC